jgi:chromosome segregation ATPase
LQKEINKEHREFKKLENENQGIEDLNKELATSIGGTEKFIEELQKDLVKYQQNIKNLGEEQAILLGQVVKTKLLDLDLTTKIIKLQGEIEVAEKTIAAYQTEVSLWNEELKFLSSIREKMARTASQASAQARMTKEELKVKELLILDLTKKSQETEFRLKSFIALYEEVKNARNKFVSQIQNSS